MVQIAPASHLSHVMSETRSVSLGPSRPALRQSAQRITELRGAPPSLRDFPIQRHQRGRSDRARAGCCQNPPPCLAGNSSAGAFSVPGCRPCDVRPPSPMTAPPQSCRSGCSFRLVCQMGCSTRR
jgi:hypothetical protein